MPTEAVGAVPSSRQRIVAPDTEISAIVAPAGGVMPTAAAGLTICTYPSGTHASMMIFGVVEPSGLGREFAISQLGGRIREGGAQFAELGLDGVAVGSRVADFLLQLGQSIACGVDLALGVLDPAFMLKL